MGGRPPKSDAHHALAGNPGKRAREEKPTAEENLAASEDAAAGDDFSAPAHLAKAAKAIWRREIDALRLQGYVRATDLKTFALYCDQASLYERARDVIERRGMTYKVKSKHGSYERPRPEVSISEKAGRMMRQLLGELGLTTRTRVGIGATIASRQLPLFPNDPPAKSPATPASAPPNPEGASDEPVGYVH